MRRNIVGPLCLMVSLLASCSESSPATTAPPTGRELLERAAETMGTVGTVLFTIERTGEPVYIDTQGFLEFVGATGRYAAPGSADAVVTVSAIGLNAEVGAVVVEGQTWLTNPVTGTWEPTPPGYAFDPATLFDPEVGWRPLLTEGAPSVEDLGEETVDEETLRRLRFTAGGERIEVITAGLVRGDDVTIDMWIEAETGEVREARFSTPIGDGLTDWHLTLFGYGSEIEIVPPDLDGTP